MGWLGSSSGRDSVCYLVFFSSSSIHLHLPFTTRYSYSQTRIVTPRDVLLPTPRHFGEKLETRDKLPFSVVCAGLHTFCCNWAQTEILWLCGEQKSFMRSIAVLSPQFSWYVICQIMIGWLGGTSEYPRKLKWNDVWPQPKNISSFIAIHSHLAPNRMDMPTAHESRI